MDRVLIFAGTTEGRELAEYLSRHERGAHVCVATEYGEQLLIEEPGIHVHTGRLTTEEMRALMERERISLVIDATHPYAVEVTRNITKICAEEKIELVRLMRDSLIEKLGKEKQSDLVPEIVLVPSVEGAVSYLSGTSGNVLVTTGSKELSKFTVLEDYKQRIFARILSTPEMVSASAELGFCGKNLICMQGPFTQELNYAMLKQMNASYLVTKESGKSGGFEEKLSAAAKAGVTVVLIGRPAQEEGSTLEEVKRMLKNRFGFPQKRKVSLIGIGMGEASNMTREAYEQCEKADVIIGAKRMLKAVEHLKKTMFASYKPEEIKHFVTLHSEYDKVAVLLSGDVGFYSGAKKLTQIFEGDELKCYCGISSVVYFCGKLMTSWEDVYLMSLHGRKQNMISAVKQHKKVFSLVGETGGVNLLCEKLCHYGLGRVKVSVGENLSYPDEKIVTATAQECRNQTFEKLCVVLIQNPDASETVTHGIEDEKFLRAKVPMTKSEVRSISLSKLKLKQDSVIYDVGAGTGSVAIEMAMRASMGTVYAIEKKEEAVELLKQNKIRFGADNLEVIEGTAPLALEGLPAPTHVFIGGSSGNLRDILQVVLGKNPKVLVVINAIALETLAEALECMKNLPVINVDIVSVSIGKSKEVGRYHMMMGNNPVYVISCEGGQVS